MTYTLSGPDSFSLKQRLKELTNTFKKTQDDLAIERFDADEHDPAAILESLRNTSLFGSNKLVIVTNIIAQKQLVEDMLELLDNIPENTTVILVSSKLDKRAKYYKQLQKQTTFEVFEDEPTMQLPNWLQTQAKQKGGSISSTDARLLIERVGSDKLLLDKELDKLTTYEPAITRESIELLSEPTPQSTIFELVDAAFSGNIQKATKLYEDQRAQRVEPLAILGMIAWQLQVLATIQAAGDRPDGDIAKEAKLNPFVIRKSRGLASRLSTPVLRHLVATALELDVRLKSETTDTDGAMKHFLFELSKATSS